nr:MAG TPA: hypothetical protein [Caudoviricetes sp.]
MLAGSFLSSLPYQLEAIQYLYLQTCLQSKEGYHYLLLDIHYSFYPD